MRRRQFQDVLVVKAERGADGLFTLTAPAVGLWRDAPETKTVLQPGMSLGQLEVLGVLHRLEVPDGAHGIVLPYPERAALARRPVGYGDPLVRLDPSATVGAAEATAPTHGAESGAQLVFRSPSSGRFYSRPSPDKPAFVTEGEVISTGHTVALLEVMKTFNRIQYGGTDLPTRAKVLRIVPADEDDLSAGQVILELEKVE